MKSKILPNRMMPGALLLAAWLGVMVAVPGLRAQPAARKVDSRFLFVFDTSAEMKHRVKAVQDTLNSILATSVGGQLHSNDSIGVWTFDQELQAGQFPLQHWNPDQAVKIASTLATYVGSRHYAKKTGFDVLLPPLKKVAQSSERLTVVIFCDGYGEFTGTPYDIGLNQVFQQRQAERQKTRQPIVIVLHAQLGEYVDCMVSFPPQLVSFPQFPPLVEPVLVAPKLAPSPVPPRPIVPPLIVIGTPVTNRVPPPAPKPLPAIPPPLTATSAPSPAVVPEAGPRDNVPSTFPSGVPAQLKISPGLLAQTNTVSRSPESTGISRVEAFSLGVAFLAVVGLVVYLFGRPRPVKKD